MRSLYAEGHEVVAVDGIVIKVVQKEKFSSGLRKHFATLRQTFVDFQSGNVSGQLLQVIFSYWTHAVHRVEVAYVVVFFAEQGLFVLEDAQQGFAFSGTWRSYEQAPEYVRELNVEDFFAGVLTHIYMK